MLAVAAAVLVVAACGDDDGGGSPAAFCSAYDSLREDDPFERLDVASPGEMKSAFDLLDEAAAAVADRAPEETAVPAERYETAVGDLVDQLRAAGYDLRNLDRPGYRQATEAYNQAAVSLENAAAATCD